MGKGDDRVDRLSKKESRGGWKSLIGDAFDHCLTHPIGPYVTTMYLDDIPIYY